MGIERDGELKSRSAEHSTYTRVEPEEGAWPPPGHGVEQELGTPEGVSDDEAGQPRDAKQREQQAKREGQDVKQERGRSGSSQAKQ